LKHDHPGNKNTIDLAPGVLLNVLNNGFSNNSEIIIFCYGICFLGKVGLEQFLSQAVSLNKFQKL